MKTIRAFIAIEMPEALLDAFTKMRNTLRRSGDGIKWVQPDRIHLTLKFLGDISPQQQSDVEAGLLAALEGVPAFTLQSEGTGAFPSLKRARVYWVGLHSAGQDQLRQLHQQIDLALATRGFPREARRFNPHLTIGRVRRNHGSSDAASAIRDYHFPTLKIPVTHIDLIKSALTPQGPIYTTLLSFPLSAAR